MRHERTRQLRTKLLAAPPPNMKFVTDSLPLEMTDIGFKYEDYPTPTLQNVSLLIPQGSMVVVAGPHRPAEPRDPETMF